VATVSASDPRNEPVQLRLNDKQEPSTSGPGLAARGRESWSGRFERGQGGRTHDGRQSAGLGTGMEVVSYLISGMLAYGGIGWVVGHFTHIPLLFPVGLGVGLAIALGWVIYHYGRAGSGRQ
jgi:ATP synthase protein I